MRASRVSWYSLGMTNTTNAYAVRYTTVNRRDEVVAKDKSFRTPDARAAWLDRDDNDVYQVLGFSDPE